VVSLAGEEEDQEDDGEADVDEEGEPFPSVGVVVGDDFDELADGADELESDDGVDGTLGLPLVGKLGDVSGDDTDDDGDSDNYQKCYKIIVIVGIQTVNQHNEEGNG